MQRVNLHRHRENELISTRLSSEEVKQVDRLVRMGYFLNRADFVRSATREKLSHVQIYAVRKTGLKEAKKAVLRYLKLNPVAYPSDIALHSGLELSTVMHAVKELWEQKKVEEVKGARE